MDNKALAVVGVIGALAAFLLLRRSAEAGPRRAAIDGMGDLNDDGYVSYEDIDIIKLYIFGYPVADISPLSEEEFLRRADMNGDGLIDAGDITAMKNFIYGG